MKIAVGSGVGPSWNTALFVTLTVLSVLRVGAQESSTTPSVVLNDASILRPTTNRIGLNIGVIDYWDSGQLLKNLIGTINPGFEPLLDQQLWLLTSAGTKTSFTDPDIYDPVVANYWQGATYSVVQSSGPELGCTGSVSSNTGPNSPNQVGIAPLFIIGTACAAPLVPGDLVIIEMAFSSTPESWWEQSKGGFSASISGGAKLLSDTSDLCDICGSQALELNATPKGSSAEANYYFDSLYSADIFVLMNGAYELSFWAKASAGSPTLKITAARLASGGYSCGAYQPTLTSSWTLYSFACTASETAAKTARGPQQVSFTVSGGSAYLDNVAFQRVETGSNSTVFRDEVMSTLVSYFHLSSGGNAGTFRDWLGQNAETVDNWTQPYYAQRPTVSGPNYFVGPAATGQKTLSLEDYLVICQQLGAEPYLEVPVTITSSDASSLIEFLAGPSSSIYGARRAALGQTQPWTTVFSQIHLAFCNECWNGIAAGSSIPWRSNEPNNEYYYDYSARAKTIFAGMRASSYYSATAFDLVMNAQTAVNYSADAAIQRARPDSIELEDYTYGYVNSFATDIDLWLGAMIEPYDKVIDPKDPSNFYQSAHDYLSQNTCGGNGVTPCQVNIYEWGQGTNNGAIDQTHMDYINAGAGEGVIAALEPLLNMQTFGIHHQSYFELAMYQGGGNNGDQIKLWGNTIDMGGATNNVRPQFLAISLVNQSIIGPMFACPISQNATYNFAGNSQNGTSVPPGIPALSSVPYLYSFCFENGNNRSIVLINTDLSNSHAVSFSGTHSPSSSVTLRQYAPSALDDLNEAPTGKPTNQTPASVELTSNVINLGSSLVLPPYSATALDYTASGVSTVAAAPEFSIPGGTYNATQTVSISDPTPGTEIYYTTDGTTPNISSMKYAGPVDISSTTSVRAFAAGTGVLNSPVASATYTILSGPLADYSSGFTPAGMALNGASILGTTLQLTTGGLDQANSAFYSTPLNIEAFTTDFTFQITDAQADGFTFVLQNSGPEAVGGWGAGLGFVSIQHSVAIKFDLFNNADEGADSTGLFTDGRLPTIPAIDLSSTPINLHSGDLFAAHITYDGTDLTLTLTDSGTQGTWSYSWPIDIPSIVGGTTAYAGFTGATGDLSSYQTITSWEFIPTYSSPNYPAGFDGNGLKLNGATYSGTALELTNGSDNEAASAYFAAPINDVSFTTDFDFQLTHAEGDGFTFVIENAGAEAVGGRGAGLGFVTIQHSVGIKFDIFDNAGEGSDSTGVYVDGAVPTVPAIDLTSSGVIMASGDLIHAHIVYDGIALTWTLTDKTLASHPSATNSVMIDIPATVGGSAAYFGFGASTGQATAIQQILDWTLSNNP